jgi:glycosylphosphatidylinositol transamidase (GPIT) subunit GPI8
MIRSTYTEGFVGFASSKVGEDSLSHHVDHDLGVYMVDRFTYHLLEFLEKIQPDSEKLLTTMKRVCPPSLCISTPVNKFNLLKPRRQKSAKVVDFFGSERSAIFTELEDSNTSAIFTELNEKQPNEIKTIKIASLADTMNEIKSLTKKTENAYLYEEKRFCIVILTIFAIISAIF